jgi:hypothetical protein
MGNDLSRILGLSPEPQKLDLVEFFKSVPCNDQTVSIKVLFDGEEFVYTPFGLFSDYQTILVYVCNQLLINRRQISKHVVRIDFVSDREVKTNVTELVKDGVIKTHFQNRPVVIAVKGNNREVNRIQTFKPW